MGIGTFVVIAFLYREDSGQHKSVAFLDVAREDVESVYIQNREGDFKIDRNEDGSYIVREFQGLPNHQNMINAYLGTITNVYSYASVSSPENLADYGLESPSCVTDITFSNQTHMEIKIGHQTPDGKGYYAIKDGDPDVYLIEADRGVAFTQSIYLLLVTEFLPEVEAEMPEKIEKIRFSGSKRKTPVELVQLYDEIGKPAQRYRMLTPYSYDADDEAMQNIIAEVTGVMRGYVEKVFPDQSDIARYGLANPDYSVTLTVGGVEYTAHVGGKAGDDTRFVKREDVDIVFRVTEARLKWFTLQPADLAASLILSRDIALVDSVSVKSETNRYDIKFGQSGGSVNGRVLSEEQLRAAYTTLGVITRNGIFDGTKTPDEVFLEVVYNYKNGQSDRVEYRKIDNGRLLCLINGEGIFYLYTNNVLRMIEVLEGLAK